MGQVDTLVVQDPAKLKLLSDPTKQKLLAEFAQPSTPLSVAKKLGLNGKGIYRHVEQLLDAEFLYVVSTRQTRGTVERTLQTTARQFIGHIGEETRHGAWDEYLSQLNASASTGLGKRMMGKATVKMSLDDWPKLVSDFAELLHKYEVGQGEEYSVHLVVIPTDET